MNDLKNNTQPKDTLNFMRKLMDDTIDRIEHLRATVEAQALELDKLRIKDCARSPILGENNMCLCPNCKNSPKPKALKDFLPPRCMECGQKLDWSAKITRI